MVTFRLTNLLIFLIVILNSKNSFINCEDKTDPNEAAEERDDIANRLYDIFSEESGTEILDEKSIGLSNSFDNFNEEIVKIYRAELDHLKENPNDVYREKKPGQNALAQNSDPIFYNWFAFSLTTKKIIMSLTHSLSSKFLEYSDISLSPKCMLAMLITLDELKQQRRWAFKMLDASGKPFLSSILEGSIISLGGYDQCLAIQSPKLLKSNPGKIHGKYCLVKYDIPLPKRPENIGIRYQLFNYTDTKMEGKIIDTFKNNLIFIAFFAF